MVCIRVEPVIACDTSCELVRPYTYIPGTYRCSDAHNQNINEHPAHVWSGYVRLHMSVYMTLGQLNA